MAKKSQRNNIFLWVIFFMVLGVFIYAFGSLATIANPVGALGAINPPQHKVLTICAVVDPSCLKTPPSNKQEPFNFKIDDSYFGNSQTGGCKIVGVWPGRHRITVWKMWHDSDVNNREYDIQRDTTITAHLRCKCGEGYYMVGYFRFTVYGGGTCTRMGTKPYLPSVPDTVAVDRNVISLTPGSGRFYKIKVMDGHPLAGIYNALDTGGAVNGNKIDFYFGRTEQEASNAFYAIVHGNEYGFVCASRNSFPIPANWVC